MPLKRIPSYSSAPAVRNTIRYDAQVAFWFRCLLSRKELRAGLQAGSLAKTDYEIVRRNHALAMALSGAEACSWAVVLVWGRFGLAVIALLLNIAARQAGARKRSALARLGMLLVAQDPGIDALPRTTLYQLCERLSRRYDVPSLVDIIYHSDALLRYAVLAVDVLFVLIWPVSAIWRWFLLMFATYHFLGVLTRTEWFASRVRFREERQRIRKDH